jgi:hypothetical protein
MKKIFLTIFAVLSVIAIAVVLGQEAAVGSALALAPLASTRHRQIFDNISKQFPGKKVVPGFLRVERVITNGRTSYQFNFTQDTGSSAATEVKLARTEQFLISHLGMFLAKKDSAAPNCEVLQTYPNGTVFADGTTFKSKFLEAIYNGYASLKVKSTVYIEALPLADFRSIGAMAQSSASTFSEVNSGMGFIELTPNVKINGNDPHELNLQLPITSSAIVANDVANMSNYIVVVARGFLIKD